MGLVGKLKSLLSRKTDGEPLAADDVAAVVPAGDATGEPVAINFVAHCPIDAGAQEIVEVSKQAGNCLEATATPLDPYRSDWLIVLTLRMRPDPARIAATEGLLRRWVERFGGRTDGWSRQDEQIPGAA